MNHADIVSGTDGKTYQTFPYTLPTTHLRSSVACFWVKKKRNRKVWNSWVIGLKMCININNRREADGWNGGKGMVTHFIGVASYYIWIKKRTKILSV